MKSLKSFNFENILRRFISPRSCGISSYASFSGKFPQQIGRHVGLLGVGGLRQRGWLSAGGLCLGTEHTRAHKRTRAQEHTAWGEHQSSKEEGQWQSV